MQLDKFDFHLPKELIAQYPLVKRSASRLLLLDRSTEMIEHLYFRNLPNLLNKDDLLVFNDTKVVPARIFSKKESGGKVEILFERVIGDKRFLAHLKANKSIKTGTILKLSDSDQAVVVGRQEDLFILELRSDRDIFDILHQIGEVPLPPYIDRAVDFSDRERYQTIFACREGAVAAPTAGLHFDEEVLSRILKKGVGEAFVTLHVGAGTFQPVRVKEIEEHRMHKEVFFIDEDVCRKIAKVKKSRGRVVAVGTTAVRSLESAASADGVVKPIRGETGIFIYPGFKFNCVDALITNFHLPKSSLLMLVAGFAGYDLTMRAYREAIKKNYRFFSYGDAMLIV